jgi:DNA mismatch endonuclease (patch repair protein)
MSPTSRAYPQPTSAAVSAVMRGNRRRDTRPEVLLRSLLHARGYRFRKDLAITVGGGRVRPDVVFTRRRVAIFVDGCFWHGCPTHGTRPKANGWYWAPKLARNQERDRRVDGWLREAGWVVVRIWEHELAEAALARILTALTARGAAVDGSAEA